MVRAPEIFWDTFATMIGVILGGTILFACGHGLSYLPSLEGWLLPVVEIDPATDIYRDRQKSCFSLPLAKLREAVPVKYEFQVETRLSAKINVSAYIANADNTRKAESDLITHPVGTVWTRRYCFELPATIADAQSFRVTGTATHDAHPLWNVQTNVPAFQVEALAP